jgi:hypothetical protein
VFSILSTFSQLVSCYIQKLVTRVGGRYVEDNDSISPKPFKSVIEKASNINREIKKLLVQAFQIII